MKKYRSAVSYVLSGLLASSFSTTMHAAGVPYPLITPADVKRSCAENHAAWDARINGMGRPRLLYDKVGFEEARKRLMDGPRSPETDTILSRAYRIAAHPPHPYVTMEERQATAHETVFSAREELWIRNVANETTALAVAAALDPAPQLKKALHDDVIAMCRYPTWGRNAGDNGDLACGHATRAVALAWDWHPDLWTPDDRALILRTVSERAGALLTNLYGKGFWAGSYADNHNHVTCNGLAWCGLAFYDDLPQAPEWLAAARLDFENVARYYPADGSSAEGVPYWSYGMTYILQYIEGTRPVLDSAKLYDAPFLKNAANFRLNASTSGLEGTLPWGDAPPRDYYGPQNILNRLANQYHDASAAWLSHHLPWAPEGGEDIFSWAALWRCDTGRTPSLPLDYHLPVADIATTRSGWGTGDYMLSVKSGFTNRNHSHLDAGALAFAFGSKWLLTAPGYGLGKNSNDFWDSQDKRWKFYSNATESHCTLLINGQNQRFDRAARGTIDRFLSAPGWSITSVDLTEAYAGVQAVRRDVLHRRNDYVLVFDAVRSKQPATVEWLAQLPDRPEEQGRALSVKGEAGQLRLEMLSPAESFASRTPTSPHVDQPSEKLHTYAVKASGDTVRFTALLQPGFANRPAPALAVSTADEQSGCSHLVIKADDWTDHVYKARGQAVEMAFPGTGDNPGVKATADLLSIRTDGRGAVTSCVAEQANALALPWIQFKPEAPTEIALQVMPEGAWILDASRDVTAQMSMAAGMTCQPMPSAALNTFRYLLAKDGTTTVQQAADWLASLLVFREKTPAR